MTKHRNLKVSRVGGKIDDSLPWNISHIKSEGSKGWCDEFDIRLNIIIGIVQKGYE